LSSFFLQVSFEILPGQVAIVIDIKEKNPSNVSNRSCINPVLCISSCDFKLRHEHFVVSCTAMQYPTDINYRRELEHKVRKYKINSKYVIPRRGCIARYCVQEFLVQFRVGAEIWSSPGSRTFLENLILSF
jgi:hypothetical protein